MRKAIAVFMAVLFITMGVSSRVSEAFVPAAMEAAQNLATAMSVAAGTTYANAQAALTVSDAIIAGLDDADGALIDGYVDQWQYSGQIEIPQAEFDYFQSKFAALYQSNQVIANMISKNIVDVTTDVGKQVTYISANSTISATSESIIPYLHFYTLPQDSLMKLSSKLGFFSINFQSSGQWKRYARVYNLDANGDKMTGSFDNMALSNNYSLSTAIEIATVVTDNSYIYFWVRVTPVAGVSTYNYTARSASSNSIIVGADALTLDVLQKVAMNPAQIAYTAYNPSVDRRGNVVIPVPYNYPYADLPGVTPGQLVGGEAPDFPGETKDYTGVLGAISAALAGIKSWTETWSNQDTSTFNLDFSPLQVNLFDRFPFSIPFDFLNVVSVFSAEPQDFKFHIGLTTSYWTIDHDVDLSPFMIPIMFFRYTVLVWFVYILISKTRSMIKW